MINNKNFNNEMQNNQNKYINTHDILTKNMNSNLKSLIDNREITDIMEKQKNIVNSNKKINFDSIEIPDKNVIQEDSNFLYECIRENKI